LDRVNKIRSLVFVKVTFVLIFLSVRFIYTVPQEPGCFPLTHPHVFLLVMIKQMALVPGLLFNALRDALGYRMEGYKNADELPLRTDIAQDPKHVIIMIRRPNTKLSHTSCLHRIRPSKSWRQGDPTIGALMVGEFSLQDLGLRP
jgi:hypothetical protein